MIEIFGVPYLKKGSGIHIKKKNRGKFTEYCGGKVTDECILKAKKSKNPKLRKRATFAANARKWKHENGGVFKYLEGTTEGGIYLKTANAIKYARSLQGLPNEFLDSWNLARLNTGRFDSLLGGGLAEQQKANRDSAPISNSPASYGKISYLRGSAMFGVKGTPLEEMASDFLNRMRNYTMNTYKRIKTVDPDTGITIMGEYNPLSHNIYANPENPTHLLHEQTHASKAKQQEAKIAEILKNNKEIRHTYYDDVTGAEPYARLMQVREANQIDPNKVWDKKSLKEFKKTAIDFNFLNRYKDNTIIDIFNNVANNTLTQDNNLYKVMLSKAGNKLIKK